jgi:Bacterial regulatory proteins, tetR family
MAHMSATSLPSSAKAGERPGLRLFTEQGFAETSVEQIAAAANVSPSTASARSPAN